MERILSRIEIDLATECWLWQGSKTGGYGHITGGYGKITVGSRTDGTAYVHRVVYEHLVGKIPEGLTIDHVRARGCVNRHCCNPDHLEPVTHRVNVQRGEAGGAFNAAKTQCPAGHLYDAENTYLSCGRRRCRTCCLAQSAAAYRAKRSSLA